MLAAKEGPLELVKRLLDAGSEINRVSINGMTALMIAVEERHIDIVRALIDAGVDVNLLVEVG